MGSNILKCHNPVMSYKDHEKQRAYARAHYENNKQKYLDSNSRRRRALKEYVNELKRSTPCTDCGIIYPYYVMDFDHIKDKKALINRFIRDNNRSGLEEELKKCELVCSNCHRVRTHSRLLEKLK